MTLDQAIDAANGRVAGAAVGGGVRAAVNPWEGDRRDALKDALKAKVRAILSLYVYACVRVCLCVLVYLFVRTRARLHHDTAADFCCTSQAQPQEKIASCVAFTLPIRPVRLHLDARAAQVASRCRCPRLPPASCVIALGRTLQRTRQPSRCR